MEGIVGREKWNNAWLGMRSTMDWVGALAMIGTVVGVERFLNRWGEWGE